MSQIKCTKCGEMFSDSYKVCPFCAEDEEYYNGKVKKRGHRQLEQKKKAPSILGPALVVVLLLLAGILVWAFAGDTIKGWFGGEQNEPPVIDQQPNKPDDSAVTPDDTDTQEPTELTLDHLTLLLAPGESAQLTVSGGSDEVYQWLTSDSSVVKVSDTGAVTAAGEGSAIVTVTCGDESVACAVTVKENADSTDGNKPDDSTTKPNDNTTKPSDSTTTKPSTGTTLKDLKIKTMYGTALDKNPDGQFDMTINSNDPPCELTLEGVSGTAKWKSSDTNVVKVSADGTLERVGPGTATVTITVGGGTAEILVRVN